MHRCSVPIIQADRSLSGLCTTRGSEAGSSLTSSAVGSAASHAATATISGWPTQPVTPTTTGSSTSARPARRRAPASVRTTISIVEDHRELFAASAERPRRLLQRARPRHRAEAGTTRTVAVALGVACRVGTRPRPARHPRQARLCPARPPRPVRPPQLDQGRGTQPMSGPLRTELPSIGRLPRPRVLRIGISPAPAGPGTPALSGLRPLGRNPFALNRLARTGHGRSLAGEVQSGRTRGVSDRTQHHRPQVCRSSLRQHRPRRTHGHGVVCTAGLRPRTAPARPRVAPQSRRELAIRIDGLGQQARRLRIAHRCLPTRPITTVSPALRRRILVIALRRGRQNPTARRDATRDGRAPSQLPQCASARRPGTFRRTGRRASPSLPTPGHALHRLPT